MKQASPFIKLIMVFAFCNIAVSQSFDSANESSLLWEITNNNGRASYLFGTDHIISGKLIDTISILKNALDNAEEVYVETDISSLDTGAMLVKTLMKKDEYYIYRSVEDSILLANYLHEKLNINAEKIYMFKPLFAAFMLTLIELPNIKELTAKDFISIDKYIYQNSLKNNQRVSFFETQLEQFSFITDSIPFNIQMDYLINVIKNKDNIEITKANKIDSCYRTFNLDCIAGKTLMWRSADPLSSILLRNRNIRWMNRIVSSINNNTAFIAVGALHLVGNDGLIELLRKEGYNVKPVILN